jgi:hypothetical protein
MAEMDDGEVDVPATSHEQVTLLASFETAGRRLMTVER